MTRARNVTSRGARGAVIATAMLAVALPISLQAQPLRGAVGAPPPATMPAPSAAAPASAPAPTPAAYTPMRPMSESVAAIVNDEIISTYDLAQRMRLLIATTGVQPTQDNLQEFQQQALLSLVDESLQIQELKRVQKDQKVSIIATDDEVQDELSSMAQQNNMKPDNFIAVLKSQGIARRPSTTRSAPR